MGKSRVYWGCEMQSPLYRQIASEIQNKKSALIENKYKIILDQNEADRFENMAVTEKDHYQKKMNLKNCCALLFCAKFLSKSFDLFLFAGCQKLGLACVIAIGFSLKSIASKELFSAE